LLKIRAVFSAIGSKNKTLLLYREFIKKQRCDCKKPGRQVDLTLILVIVRDRRDANKRRPFYFKRKIS
ncbi:MAG: hypothetical protein IJE97_12835, partial [Thermoguttaceae bacterium]|nr:hypothetical protein [Thermoguttaceae bacterium]